MEVLKFNWSFDRVAEIYDRTRGLPTPVMERLISVLCSELNDCGRILDVGVGTGRFAEPLQKAGFDVVGIDISRKMLAKAKEKHVQNLLLADACSTPFVDKVFDVTISVHVLHLISEWKRTLREVCRVTHQAMISLYEAHEDPVQEAYHSLLRQYGTDRRKHPGKSEEDLQAVVRPTKTLFVTSYDLSADDRLTNLQQRTSSSQWELPRNINLEVVEQLRPQFAGKVFRQDLYVQTWSIDSLKAFTEE